MRGFLPKPVGYHVLVFDKKTSTVVQFFCSPFRTELTDGRTALQADGRTALQADGRTALQADGRTDGRFVVIWFSFYVFVFLVCGTFGSSHTAFFGVEGGIGVY